MQEMERSYREALRALNGSKSRVIHIEDLSQNGVYDEEFPVEMEKNIGSITNFVGFPIPLVALSAHIE